MYKEMKVKMPEEIYLILKKNEAELGKDLLLKVQENHGTESGCWLQNLPQAKEFHTILHFVRMKGGSYRQKKSDAVENQA